MFNSMKKLLFGAILAFVCIASVGNMNAYRTKAMLADFGKVSKVNGLPKTKITSGHLKHTRKGYPYVNSYARSR